MAASLVRAARHYGVAADGIPLLSAAHALAMAPRVATLTNQRHPSYLHPGHTALILLRDAGVVDAVVLAAAALTESEDADLRIPLERIRAEAGDEVADLVNAVPLPGGDELTEALVVASEAVRLVALAERLDHARHAHMREADDAWRRAIHEQAMRVYLPVAERTHAKLAGRFRHWGEAFERRLARGPSGAGRGEGGV